MSLLIKLINETQINENIENVHKMIFCKLNGKRFI